MHRKAFRCGVLALLLAAALVLPAAAAVPRSRSSRPAPAGVTHGIFERAAKLMADLFTHLTGANRGGIDPNGRPLDDPAPSGTAAPGEPGDNRGGIDPNG